jgi:hypothetical protein
MPLRTQYLEDIRLDSNPYPNDPVIRIRDASGSSRRGTIGYELAEEIWKQHLSQIYRRINNGTLPTSPMHFDDFVVNAALGVEGLLMSRDKGYFGKAQKIVNLFFKDLWALRIIPDESEPLLHAPLDRSVLSKFKWLPPVCKPWTKAKGLSSGSTTVNAYLSMQNRLRESLCTPLNPFPSVIQMEQFLWHQIP